MARNALTPEQREQHPNWGGPRPGQLGRPKGIPNPRRDILDFRRRFPVFPVEYFLMVLNDKLPVLAKVKGHNQPKKDKNGNIIYRKFNHEEKMEAAKNAAPYLHPRLAAVELSGPEGGPVKHSIDVTKLSDEELNQFERLLAKSQIITLNQEEYDDVTDKPSGVVGS